MFDPVAEDRHRAYIQDTRFLHSCKLPRAHRPIPQITCDHACMLACNNTMHASPTCNGRRLRTPGTSRHGICDGLEISRLHCTRLYVRGGPALEQGRNTNSTEHLSVLHMLEHARGFKPR